MPFVNGMLGLGHIKVVTALHQVLLSGRLKLIVLFDYPL